MRILYLEPFDAGSHAAFTRSLVGGIDADWTVLTMPGRHWKWRARGAAPYWALEARAELESAHDLLFASAYLNLAELLGLVPALARVPSILYFHENQLAFPVREVHAKERDFHFGFSQLISALAATRCVFNSEYNRSSFLEAGESLLRRMPDRVPSGLIQKIEAKSEVLPLPLPSPPPFVPRLDDGEPPLVLWNHRWEYDKGPDRFFEAMTELSRRGVPFRLAVCGQAFAEVPEVFTHARAALAPHIECFGPIDDRAEYESLLSRSDIAVSTAAHEFFGISMLEAIAAGARPLVPDGLAYRELIPEPYRYRSQAGLIEALERLLSLSEPLRADRRELVEPLCAPVVLPRYQALFCRLIERDQSL